MWNVRRVISVSSQFVWDIQALIIQSINTLWNLRFAVIDSIQPIWDTLSNIPSLLLLSIRRLLLGPAGVTLNETINKLVRIENEEIEEQIKVINAKIEKK